MSAEVINDDTRTCMDEASVKPTIEAENLRLGKQKARQPSLALPIFRQASRAGRQEPCGQAVEADTRGQGGGATDLAAAQIDFLEHQETLSPAPCGNAGGITPSRFAESAGTTSAISERLWGDYLSVLVDGRRLIESKVQYDQRAIVAIARLYECHTGGWSYFLSTKKIGTGRPAKSDFHPIVMHWLGATADRTGHATVVCAVLDEWARGNPRLAPDEIPQWLKDKGGPNAIYRERRARARQVPTRDEKDAAVHELCELPPMGSSLMPPELQGLDGDHLVLAHFDSIRQTVEIKGIVRKVDQAWLRANAIDVLGGRTRPSPRPVKPNGPIDEFFTKPEVAAELFEKTLGVVSDRPGFREATRWLEPSAGEGAFYKLLPRDKRLGIDIAAKVPGVIEHDFLTFRDFGEHRYFCIGNPPFTKGAAVHFFNYAARVSRYIAFVVTETFSRASIQRKLDRHFHLVATLPVPDMAFRHGGRECSVPTIYQIWERREELRPLPVRETSEECADLEFLPSSEGASYIIKNVGEQAGRSIPIGSEASLRSHFFIGCDDAAVAVLNSIKWPPRIPGIVRHLSKAEIIRTYKTKKRSQLSKFTH